jgi:hypothetical protein
MFEKFDSAGDDLFSLINFGLNENRGKKSQIKCLNVNKLILEYIIFIYLYVYIFLLNNHLEFF